MLIFNCLAPELTPARSAHGNTGGIWAVPTKSPLGPYDISAATQLTDNSLYVGKLVQDRTGAAFLLAFHNTGPDGDFVGALSDPMPVRWNADTLTVTNAGNFTNQSVGTAS